MRPPIAFPFMILAAVGLFFGLILLFILVQVGLVTVAFSKLGLSGWQVFLVLFATLIGSGVNIPLMRTGRMVNVPISGPRMFMDASGRPVMDPGEVQLVDQRVAVNVGGCIIPLILSLKFISHITASGEPLGGLIASVLVVSALCYTLARPVPGKGIGVPVLIPPLATAFAALMLAPADFSPHVAYVAGTCGILLGADVLHLMKKQTTDMLDAPLLSIGGAGTFDGIFLTGIIAVLLA